MSLLFCWSGNPIYAEMGYQWLPLDYHEWLPINGDGWLDVLPSAKLVHNELENHNAINGYINYK